MHRAKFTRTEAFAGAGLGGIAVCAAVFTLALLKDGDAGMQAGEFPAARAPATGGQRPPIDQASGVSEPHVVEADQENERYVQLEDLPAVVRQAVTQAAGDHAITEIEEETDGDVITYEVGWNEDAAEREVSFTTDGRRYQEEVGIKAADLPPAVNTTATTLAGGALTGVELERVSVAPSEGEPVTLFEMEYGPLANRQETLLNADGREVEIQVDVRGQVSVVPASVEDAQPRR